jgi:hypothetical protein
MKNNETRTRGQIIDDIIDFFAANDDVLIECIEDLDVYNGYLGDDRYYDMEMIDEFYVGADPTEILRRAFYGYDVESCYTDSRGEKVYGKFNPNREYFRYNGYGNLVSCDYKDYSDHNDVYFVVALIENRNNIDSIDDYDDLVKLLEEYENAAET